MGILQSQFPRQIIHLFHEAFHGAAAVDGEGHRRIIAGGQHQPVQKLLQGKDLPLL